MGRSQLTIILLAALCVVGLYFDFFYQSASDDTSSLSLRFSWIGIPACASTSPPFQLGSVPTGTKYLSFTMTDLNAPSFHHGGSTVSYSGNYVRQGAVAYTGPCPPGGQRHNYRWSVQALDAGGTVLAKASAEATVPP
jgi:phosphatidylethanolamine-binding protein (PEBP) family uncharacterized protein